MPTIHVNLKDLSQALVKDLRGKENQAVRAIRRAVQEHGPRLAAEVVDETKPRPVDRGTYRRSFRADDLPQGAALYNYAPHAGVIEDGRRAGARQPPVEVIEAWLRRKLRVAIKEGQVGPMSPRAWRSAAFVIARAIGRRGLPAHRILARVNSRLQPLVLDAVNRALLGQGGP